MIKNIFVLSVLIFIGCEKQPSCDDAETKALANDLARDLITRDVALAYFVNSEDSYDFRYSLTGVNYEKQIQTIRKIFMDEVEYKNTDTTSYFYYYTQKARNRVEEIKPKLTNIRVSKIENELRKCSCEAEYSSFVDNFHRDVEFNVQINDNDEIFVELGFLE